MSASAEPLKARPDRDETRTRAGRLYDLKLLKRLWPYVGRQKRALWAVLLLLPAEAALRSVDQLAALAELGLGHESLAPLSHSEARWRWNYFRWDNLRFGPSAIHNWLEALKYPNLRLSGLADFGHIVVDRPDGCAGRPSACGGLLRFARTGRE